MMTERLKFKGRLVEAEDKARQLRLSMEGDLKAVRDLLDPFESIEGVRADLAAAQAVELAGKHADYLGLLKEIKAIKKALGE
jgi:hypothetical protein